MKRLFKKAFSSLFDLIAKLCLNFYSIIIQKKIYIDEYDYKFIMLYKKIEMTVMICGISF